MEEEKSLAEADREPLPFSLPLLLLAVDFLPLDLGVFDAKWRSRRRDEGRRWWWVGERVAAAVVRSRDRRCMVTTGGFFGEGFGVLESGTVKVVSREVLGSGYLHPTK